MKKEVTLDEMRTAIHKVMTDNCYEVRLVKSTQNFSDEQLLLANLETDLGLDSLDITEVIAVIEESRDLPACSLISYVDLFKDGQLPSVENLLQTLNVSLLHYD